ncbi:hypothetical protein LOY54_22560 [Pseudomonas sp. B21-032]|nr:hypothetical protein [Pseudomonas sp. B21-032]UVL60774.1 hypothetical protein LOY54_22560 [Pseudomonas sp. B21-032]
MRHIVPTSEGGALYDLDNLRILTPKNASASKVISKILLQSSFADYTATEFELLIENIIEAAGTELYQMRALRGASPLLPCGEFGQQKAPPKWGFLFSASA